MSEEVEIVRTHYIGPELSSSPRGGRPYRASSREMEDLTVVSLGRIASDQFTPPGSPKYDIMYHTHLTGPIRINDLLLCVFSYLTVHDLLSVVRVCTAWRERAGALETWRDLVVGNYNEYVERCKHRRLEMKRVERARRLQWRHDVTGCSMYVISYWTLASILLVSVGAACWYIGYDKNSSSGDALIGVGAFFTAALILPPFLFTMTGMFHDFYKFTSIMPKKNVTQFFSAIVCFGGLLTVSYCIPLGLLGGRARSLNLILDAPVVNLNCSTTYYDVLFGSSYQPPAFVTFSDGPQWIADMNDAEVLADAGWSIVPIVCKEKLVYPRDVTKPPPRVYVLIRGHDLTAYNQSWHPRASHRTPFPTTYYNGDVDGIGVGWFRNYAGRWHKNRHAIIFADPPFTPSKYSYWETSEEVRNHKESMMSFVYVSAIVVSSCWGCTACLFHKLGTVVLVFANLIIFSGLPPLVMGIVCTQTDVCYVDDDCAMGMLVCGAIAVSVWVIALLRILLCK